MKKTVSILLCLVIAVTMLTGCSDAEQTEQLIRIAAGIAEEYIAEGNFDSDIQSEYAPADENSAADAADSVDAENVESIEDAVEVAENPAIVEAAEETAVEEVHKEGRYSIEWNLEDIYADDDAWNKDYDKAAELIEKLGDYRGRLNTAQGIYDFVSFALDGELTNILYKLSLYAQCKSSINAADSTAINMNARLTQLDIKKTQELAYVDDEIFSMSLEERKKIFADPILEKYAYALKAYTDEDTVHYTEETNSALAVKNLASGAAYDIYQTLLYVDMPKAKIETPDGEVVELTNENYKAIRSGDYDHDFKLKATEAYYGAAADFANTYAKTLEYTIREYIASARLKGYDSYAECAFDSEDVEPEIYEKMKKTAHDMLPDYHKYLEYKKQQSGLEHFYTFDTDISDVNYDGTTTYDETCERMLKVLSILGDDYTDVVSRVISEGHVDVYPKSGKTTGAFEISCHNKDVLPYILMNYTGDMQSTTSLCHEMGHAMYAYFSENNSNLNATNNAPRIFTHEVTSINNEFLLGYDGMDNASSEEEKMAYAESLISLISSAVLSQMMLAELEEYLYDTVEAGGALDAEMISDKWMELNKEYDGGAVEYPENYRYRWAEIPHFYFGYYVYKYATSCTYAAATSRNIYEGRQDAVKNYREFLTLGASDKPSELLKVAGVDPLDDKSYNYIKNVWSELIDTYCTE